MKLYYTKTSPFAACVRAVIAELNATDKVEMIESHPFSNDEEFLAINPLGKVPCLIDLMWDEEKSEAIEVPILDSEVICDYLDANLNSGWLFHEIYANWQLKTFYSICSGLMDCIVHLQMEKLREKDKLKSDFWYHRHTDAITRTLDDIENRLALIPEEFTIIHISLICSLAYLDFRHSEINWRKKRKKLTRFFETWKERKCFLSAVYS